MVASQVPILKQQGNEPELADAFEQKKRETMLAINCHHIGTIQSFNPATQTAQVSINYQQTYFRNDPVTDVYGPVLVDYPLLIDVPVFVLGGAGPVGAALTMPIQKGDECLLCFNDRDIDNWFAGSSSVPPASLRLHDFSDAIALVGIRSFKTALTAYDSSRAVLRVGSNSRVAVAGMAASLESGNAIVKADGTPNKVLVGNGTYTLNGLLQNLLTQLSALCTDINSLVTATAAITVPYSNAGTPSTSGLPNNIANITAVSTTISSVSSSISNIGTQLGSLLE